MASSLVAVVVGSQSTLYPVYPSLSALWLGQKDPKMTKTYSDKHASINGCGFANTCLIQDKKSGG